MKQNVCIGAYKITNDEKPIIASYYYMGEADNKTLDSIQICSNTKNE